MSDLITSKDIDGNDTYEDNSLNRGCDCIKDRIPEKQITIPFRGWYKKHRLFEIAFKRGLTTIVGKNGSGKSSLISELNQYLKSNNIPVYRYDRESEGYRVSQSGFLTGNFDATSEYYSSSEGEKIIVAYSHLIGNIKEFLIKNSNAEFVFLLYDGLDSGLSINIIRDLQDIFNLMMNDFPNLYIINTTNNYEFTKDSRCILAKNGKDIEINSYDDFVKVITKKDRVRKTNAEKNDNVPNKNLKFKRYPSRISN